MADIKSGPLTADQMTYVTDAAGEVQPNQVPKHWIGTALLPEGYKAASKKAAAEAEADNGDDSGDAA